MDAWLIVAFAAGWGVARIDDILSLFKERTASKERMSLFDKALTKGDGAALYNLRVADAVSQRPETVEAATASDLQRHESPDSNYEFPWSNHPLYGRCEVYMDPASGLATIFDPEAPDGPDTWTEAIPEFMARFEAPPQ